jgi:hypothetical protein
MGDMDNVDDHRRNNGQQNAPVQDGALDATADEKKRGLLQQVAADSNGVSEEETARALNQRLTEAGVPVDDAELRDLMAQLPSLGWERAAPTMEVVNPSPADVAGGNPIDGDPN